MAVMIWVQELDGEGPEQEAVLQLRENEVQLCVFGWPPEGKGIWNEVLLSSLLTTDIYREDAFSPPKKLVNSLWAYRLTATVSDRDKSLVTLGSITIDLGCKIPGDISNGEPVSFTVQRLDLISKG